MIFAFDCPPPPVPETVDVYLLMGQSNMDGMTWTVNLDPVPEFLETEHEEVLFCYQSYYGEEVWLLDKWSPLQTMNGRFGPEISLGLALHEAQPDRRIALLKSSRGGSNLYEDWDPESTEGVQLYRKSLEFIEARLVDLKEMGFAVNLCGVVWFQGEGDCNKTVEIGKAYRDNLERFIGTLRKDLHHPDLPFILTRVYANRPGVHLYRDPVRRAIVEIAEEDPLISWVNIDDLEFMDHVHLDGASQIVLGKRFTEAILKQNSE